MTAGSAGVVVAVDVVAAVADPELPMVTLADLGILRDVRVKPDGGVDVAITPTYSGCPAMVTIRDDIVAALARAGFGAVNVRTVLSPAWTTDWITESGKAKLAAAGIAPPGAAPKRGAGPVPLMLGKRRTEVACPRCGHGDTEQIAAFSATACRELRRCPACQEPFEHVKEI
ncbi:MAG TPA: 1,2-phenylacetyl-CoA epoxidase subunit PaaD [Pseudonocardia sp.]